MTHQELVGRAAAWLRNKVNCGVVLAEPTGCAEVPDAIGWKYGHVSTLVECKVSRADFHADRAKPHRRDPSAGMGWMRYYLSPPDVVVPADLPEGWGLLHTTARGVRSVVPVPWGTTADPRSRSAVEAEMRLLVYTLAKCADLLADASLSRYVGPTEEQREWRRAQARQAREWEANQAKWRGDLLAAAVAVAGTEGGTTAGGEGVPKIIRGEDS